MTRAHVVTSWATPPAEPRVASTARHGAVLLECGARGCSGAEESDHPALAVDTGVRWTRKIVSHPGPRAALRRDSLAGTSAPEARRMGEVGNSRPRERVSAQIVGIARRHGVHGWMRMTVSREGGTVLSKRARTVRSSGQAPIRRAGARPWRSPLQRGLDGGGARGCSEEVVGGPAFMQQMQSLR